MEGSQLQHCPRLQTSSHIPDLEESLQQMNPSAWVRDLLMVL
jgi:hypothetical protein